MMGSLGSMVYSLCKKSTKEKKPVTDVTGNFSFQSDRAGNFTRAQAAGAGVDILRGTVHDRLHALDIGVPGTVAPTMRVRNLDTERDTLATARTFGHIACTSFSIAVLL